MEVAAAAPKAEEEEKEAAPADSQVASRDPEPAPQQPVEQQMISSVVPLSAEAAQA